MQGSTMPASVARLLEGLVVGEIDTSGLGPGAVWAYGADREREVAPRSVAMGDAIAVAIRDDLDPGRGRLDVHLWAADEANCLLEGSLVERASSARLASWFASFQLEDGLVTRALTFRCDPVEPSETWAGAAPARHSARDAVDGYFHDLDAARLEAAAGWFSDDVLYSHPPYFPGTPRAEFRGRDELLAGFERRGPRTNRHEVVVCLQRGRDCLIEGWSHKPEKGISGQFVSSLSLDDDGRMRRYVALYCEPGYGRA